MKRIYLNFICEPTDHLYRALLEYAVLDCKIALLVIRKSLHLNELGNNLLSQLDPFLVKETECSEWPGTRLLNRTARVLEFSFVPGSVAIFKQAVNSLYAWRQPDFPEDLCLLREDGDPWLVSIAHEQDGFLSLAPNEMVHLFKTLPEIRRIIKR